MGSIARPNTYTPGTDADATEANENEELIYNEFNGGIDDVNIRGSAAINGSKLASSPSGVPTAKINDDAVTDAKLADHGSDDALRAVGSNHIKTNAIIKEKVKVTIASFQLTGITIGAGDTFFPIHIAGSSFTPAIPGIGSCIPLHLWISRTDSDVLTQGLGFCLYQYVGNAGSIYVSGWVINEFVPVPLPLDFIKINLSFIPVS